MTLRRVLWIVVVVVEAMTARQVGRNGPVTRAKPARRDAQQRRQRLLEAAVECFGEFGFNVALEEIMERAQVGRGTFYRNFKDRMALVYAILEQQVDRLNVSVDPDLPISETMSMLVFGGVQVNRLFTRMAADMPLNGDALAAYQSLSARFEMLMEPVVESARIRGEFDRSVDGRKLALALRMIASLLHPIGDHPIARAQVDDAVELILSGLRPRSKMP